MIDVKSNLGDAHLQKLSATSFIIVEDSMEMLPTNKTQLVILADNVSKFSVQDKVLLGALSTVGTLVILALTLRFLKQPCKDRIQNGQEKTEYDRYCSSSSLEDTSSDVSFQTSSSGFSESSGSSSQATQISYCSSESSLKSENRSITLSSSLPDLTGKNAKSINLSSPTIFALNTELMPNLSSPSESLRAERLSEAERDSIKYITYMNTSLSNSFLSLTSSQSTDKPPRDPKNATVEHTYGKYLPKFYKKTNMIKEDKNQNNSV
ncbi:uncharacterized protein LOC125661929 isoform X2 [Ostrea edulis]|uniref:uncharacterized protein LOC125661929 isoform X2 n=1 Tax=Ostrea edulis TaxID=37623 RepID=UPI0024AF9423|nr:uncharacterized protein LOC125661929 isoform X2 [Ostrea edulis]XP_056003018.1 uncharacterized protein LOC125661929 isoform X2 [Ostrea edulis]